MRNKFLLWGAILVISCWAIAVFLNNYWWIPVVLSILYGIGIYNANQTKHAILRNFPVLGYFRYFFESVSTVESNFPFKSPA